MSSSDSIAVEYVPIDELRLDPGHPRRADQATADRLADSIRRHGLLQPVIARPADKLLVAGYLRVSTARAVGLTRVPVIWFACDDTEASLLGLTLNKVSAAWDEPLLAPLLRRLREEVGADALALAGFADDEVRRLIASLDARERGSRPESFDLEAELALSRRTRTSVGEVWRLADHTLAVGDCTDPAVVDGLLGGGRAAMCITDPPYNVDYTGGGRAGRRQRRIANDALPREAWLAFVGRWAGLVVGATDGALYVFMSGKEWATVSAELAAAGGHWSTTIVWTKDRPTLGRADYQRAFEPIWYGWREGSAHHWCGDRDQTDVWAFDRPDASPLHPTQKPLGIFERAIKNSSRPGDLVLDPFAGSGTAILGCERTGRRCAAVELDPRYADAALARWEAFSGLRAERLEPGPEGGAV